MYNIAMSQLTYTQKVQVLSLLVDGMSMRGITRATGVAFNTVRDLLVKAGELSLQYHDTHVRNLTPSYVQCDEIWSYVYKKQKNINYLEDTNKGDMYTWTAIDEESKLILSYFTGRRNIKSAATFIGDLAKRTNDKFQITTDGLKMYIDVIEELFGCEIDYAQDLGFGEKIVIQGNPDPDHITTSHVERQNLTMRMCMRRFTRQTNGFSKKIQNHIYMVALYFLYYNFVRSHKSLDDCTPAMAAGLDNSLHDIGWIVEQLPYNQRGPYKKRHFT